jgi:hypothetical protein
MIMAKKHIKYAGVDFSTKAAPSKINRFVRELPEQKRQSLHQVTEELTSAGLITPAGGITHGHTHNLYTGD